jgi:hypothetical protein
MNEIAHLKPHQLRHAADLLEQIESLQSELTDILGVASEMTVPRAMSGVTTRKRKLSRQGLANIRAGVAKRMAKKRMQSSGVAFAERPKTQRSAAWRKALSAALKRRWAARKAQGESSL